MFAYTQVLITFFLLQVMAEIYVYLCSEMSPRKKISVYKIHASAAAERKSNFGEGMCFAEGMIFVRIRNIKSEYVHSSGILD